MKASEIRKKFLDFFRSKEHYILSSYSLIPDNDPTLLWINCGMAPLKDYYAKRAIPPSPRMANSQKSLRTNDIENVGKTARHHTMFEMLGNFSIGDYFKKEAISWAWEFLVDVLKMDTSKMYVTIHPDDDEAFNIWHNHIGLAEKRIFKMSDNFWEIGPGPCGPNSEIFYDRGESFGCNSSNCTVGCECDRYVEVWNLVFTQFNKEEDGTLTDLPYKNIDTGMGLERLAAIIQNVESNYETDLFTPIIEEAMHISGVPYVSSSEAKVAYRVIADHIRSVSFAVADGALPSNEGRGYVIRRLLRRAIRYGRTLGLSQPFMHILVSKVVEVMADHYTYLTEKQDLIERIVLVEERRFLETLDDGMELLSQLISELKSAGQSEIKGADAFRLYDTYGFPLDLTIDMAEEAGFLVDTKGFEDAMAEQRERARRARKDAAGNTVETTVFTEVVGGDVFVGYNELECQSDVLAIVYDNELINEAGAECKVEIVLTATPFYAESGGQVADTGIIQGPNACVTVEDVRKLADGKIVHKCKLASGKIHIGDKVEAKVDGKRRNSIARHHSATHLLHEALRRVLGSHVNQSGSLVTNERLRFDFSHYDAVSVDELELIEGEVNRQIFAGIPIETLNTSLEEARAMGAKALFSDKYGDTVRVVKMGDFSMELCGGCHSENTAQIGMFFILSESSIGSGIRRIEALAGRAAYEYSLGLRNEIRTLSNVLKANPAELEQRVEAMVESNRMLNKQIQQLQSKLASSAAADYAKQVVDVSGVPVLAIKVEATDMDALRKTADAIRDKIGDAVVVLGAAYDEKVGLVAMVADNLLKKHPLHAGKLIGKVAKICGGGGGGRPNMAQAGGKNPAALGEAMDKVLELVQDQLNK